ncbi:molecular chaperone [Saccharobesus litoralis]|uniref:Molecular chaperone n=1 Tax=Saccharobesus litoralis TaxID=2172099 RepID=A0A2S0VRR3_9ALTE|nr:molecular chaperone [Saccharobesus litoralis]AWB66911.1 molecular chaperone [Saccharobesus litoralis]
MNCGLDFGTSHCALGVSYGQQTEIVPLFTHNDKPTRFMPSTLYAFERGLISDYIYQALSSQPELATGYLQARKLALQKAPALRRNHDLTANETACFVGHEAISEYLEFPEEGYFVKSPKSFLGASGLQANQIEFFEDLVTAMMLSVKNQAEKHLQQSLQNVVIGRPVNFQGINSEHSNKQAIDILTLAAQRCGFQQVEFLYEPLAAGIDFESQLDQEKTVLVVDIGGGTTDCSMVIMGPDRQQLTERQGDFLAHTGKRVGGNDLDIFFAYKQLMPLFGLGSEFKTGKSLPTRIFWDAVATNDVVAQTEFYSRSNANALDQLTRDAAQGHLIKRLYQLQQTKQNNRLVRSAELAKIQLSEQPQTQVELDYISHGLNQQLTPQDFADAIQAPIKDIQSLIVEAINQAQCQPDVIYLTGGSAKSPVLRQAVLDAVQQAHQQSEQAIPLLDGDYFGSVTAGLAKWASRIYA